MLPSPVRASSPLPASQPQQQLPMPVALETEVLLAGFRDCSKEAISYLIQEENLSPDDPLVLGLQRHLAEREEELYRAQNPYFGSSVVGNMNQGLSFHTMPFSTQQCYNNVTYPNYGYGSCHFLPHVTTPVLPHDFTYQPITALSEAGDNLSMSDDSALSDMDSDTDTSLCDSEVEDILIGEDLGDTESSDLEEIPQHALVLSGLAENNDKIGSLLTELFDLMEEEEMENELLREDCHCSLIGELNSIS